MHTATRLLALAGLLPALLCAALPAGAAVTDYVVQIQNANGGHLRVDTGPDGRVTTDFSFRNNGRGPDIKETLQLAPTGEVLSYAVTGRSTFGAEIRENFAVAGGRLRWDSRIDKGDQAVEPGTLFVPVENTPHYIGLLAQALLARPGGAAPVVGNARLVAQVQARVDVDGPQGKLPVRLVSITGADTQPWYVWLQADGSLFGMAEPGWSCLPKGYESNAPALAERQREVQDARLAQLQKQLARPLPGLTLIRAVRWFDARAAVMRGPSDVWLHGGRITAVTAPGALSLQADQVVDGADRTLLPGLFDMHVHLSISEGPLHLAAGVTTVRDMGSRIREMAINRARLDAGEVPGPGVVPAGFIEGKSPFSSSSDFLIESVDAGKAAIDWYAANGYRMVKLYNSIKPEWVPSLAAHAHKLGLRVGGHVPAFMRAEQAVRGGYDELTHINQVMLNFVTRPGDDSRTLVRFTRIGDDARLLDLSSPRARNFIRLLRERGVAVDPTAVTFEAMLTQRQGEPSRSLVDVAEHLPALWQRYIKVATMDLEGDKLGHYRASFEKLMALTMAMYRAGIPIVPGTDGSSGVGLHRELALYVKAGMTPAQALQSATWTSAQVAGESAQRGSIERGKMADLVLVEGDPSVRITDLRRASLVLKGGVAYAPALLYEAMGFRRFVEPARVEVLKKP